MYAAYPNSWRWVERWRFSMEGGVFNGGLRIVFHSSLLVSELVGSCPMPSTQSAIRLLGEVGKSLGECTEVLHEIWIEKFLCGEGCVVGVGLTSLSNIRGVHIYVVMVWETMRGGPWEVWEVKWWDEVQGCVVGFPKGV
eukprot:125520-Ditylum_brightwellii.AAC.1